MAQETRDVVRASAVSIWLKADLDLLVERVSRKPGKRPLLAKGNAREILQQLLDQREPIYGRADLHVQSQGGTKSQMRDIVLENLNTYLSSESADTNA